MNTTNDLLQSMTDFGDNPPAETSRDQKGPLAGKTDLDYALLDCFGILNFPNSAMKKRWMKVTARALGGRLSSIAFERFSLHVLEGLDVSSMSMGQVITMLSNVSDKNLIQWHEENKEEPNVER